MNDLENLKKELKKHSRPEKAKALKKFFKTGKGEYGEGDLFLGLKTEETVNAAMKYKDLGYLDLKKLLLSKIHEQRSAAVVILVNRFLKGNDKEKNQVFNFYLKNYKGINNWDLVDISAPKIVGGWLYQSGKSRAFLYDWAKSSNLWKRRIAIMATFYFIRQNDYKDGLKIAEMLLNDKEDLIHKATGWMIREVGNRSLKTELTFLNKNVKKMPRTMLRYAIEKFPEPLRQKYLNK